MCELLGHCHLVYKQRVCLLFVLLDVFAAWGAIMRDVCGYGFCCYYYVSWRGGSMWMDIFGERSLILQFTGPLWGSGLCVCVWMCLRGERLSFRSIVFYTHL